MIDLRIHYPTQDVHETVQARLDQTGASYELTTHANFLPLAPGDVVMADDTGIIRKVLQLEKQHVYEVNLHVPPGEATVAQVEATEAFFLRVHHQTWITRFTTWTFAVSGDKQWLDDRLASDPMVDWVDEIRTPTFAIDFDVAVLSPDLDGLRAGPWT